MFRKKKTEIMQLIGKKGKIQDMWKRFLYDIVWMEVHTHTHMQAGWLASYWH
jgi:hypothetical protein